MAGFAVEVHGLCKRYSTSPGQTLAALDGVSFSIPAGGVVAVMGPSGSGKSTLLHLVGAMDEADEGTIQVGETEVTSLSRRGRVDYRRTIGFVFQRFHLLPALTVRDNIAAPLLPRRSRSDKFARARELAAAVGLEARQDELPSRLSGGQQQRVAIARALLNDSGLLLADEPTGNLDSKTGGEIMRLLLELRDRRAMTILVATHDGGVASVCDQVLELRDGRLVDR